MDLNFVDLFSCGGGMSTGFTKQGAFRTIGAVDLEVGTSIISKAFIGA
jgi:DNA (cytosine-5)-methyltransferase 1